MQTWCNLQVKLCDLCLSAFEALCVKMRYTNRRILLTAKKPHYSVHIWNWAVDFLQNHVHCTKYAGQVSAVAVIQASVIQGSAIDMARLLRRHRGRPASDPRPEPDLQIRGRHIYIWLCRASIQTRAKKRLITYKRRLLTTI